MSKQLWLEPLEDRVALSDLVSSVLVQPSGESTGPALICSGAAANPAPAVQAATMDDPQAVSPATAPGVTTDNVDNADCCLAGDTGANSNNANADTPPPTNDNINPVDNSNSSSTVDPGSNSGAISSDLVPATIGNINPVDSSGGSTDGNPPPQGGTDSAGKQQALLAPRQATNLWRLQKTPELWLPAAEQSQRFDFWAGTPAAKDAHYVSLFGTGSFSDKCAFWIDPEEWSTQSEPPPSAMAGADVPESLTSIGRAASPQFAGTLDDPPQLSALETALGQFLRGLDEVGAHLDRLMGDQGWQLWLASLLVLGTSMEIVRRQIKSPARLWQDLANGIQSKLTFVAGSQP